MAGAGTIGDVAATALLNYLFHQTAYLHSSVIWIGLSTTTPNDDGSNVTEPVGNNYSRQDADTDEWETASGSEIQNALAISFPTASGSWGTVTHFVLYDAQTSGNFLGSGTINGGSGQAIGLNDILQFAVHAITVTLA